MDSLNDPVISELLSRIANLESQVKDLRDPEVPEQSWFAESLAWSGVIRVAGKKWTDADITGTASPYVKVFFDGTTAPAYTTQAIYDDAQYADEYEVFNLGTTAGDIHVVRA